MKIHHLNCASLSPLGGPLFDRLSTGFWDAHLVCHCLLIETLEGLVLIDSGLGLRDISGPKKRMNRIRQSLYSPLLRPEETAYHQIQKLGYTPADVRHIILTHLDFDHAGGIDDFPDAHIHVMEEELKAATHPQNMNSRFRYHSPQSWENKKWLTYYPEGEKWFGFDAVKQLQNLPPEILLIPLTGHSQGHAGVAVQTDKGWLLHAGDAYFFRGELNRDYSCPVGLRTYQKLIESNSQMRHFNALRLKDLVHAHSRDIRIFCSHDRIEFLDLSEETTRVLAHDSRAFENVLKLKQQGQETGPAVWE
jgi:glyoxylase-like metal-dependent hydrolase (beta-lactamase superfamily II)